MAGTSIAAKKMAKALKMRDPDYYRKIGKLGGTKSRGGGFTKETASYYGRIGGRIGGLAKGRNTKRKAA